MDRYFSHAGRPSRTWSRLSGTGVALAAATLILLVICASALAYTPGKRVWTKKSGTKAHGRTLFAAAAGTKGVFYAGGEVYTSSAQDYDALIVKYDAAGKVLWKRTWTSAGARVDEVWYLAVSAKGDVYALVYTSPTGGAASAEVIKYSAAGKRKWVAMRPGTIGFGTSPNGLALDRSGNAVVACTSALTPNSNAQGIDVAKYAAGDGTETWSSSLYPDPGSWADGAAYWETDVAVDAAGDAFVAGAARDGVAVSDHTDAVVARFSAASGVETHARVTAYPNGSVYTKVAVRGSVVALAGWAATIAPGEQESALVATYATDLSSPILRPYRTSSAADERDFAEDVAIGRHGDVFITGYVNQPPPGGDGWYDGCLTARFSPTLGTTPLWSKLYKPGSGTRAGADGQQIVLDSSDNVYVGGYTELPGGMDNEDAIIFKYSAAGKQKWKVVWGDTAKESDGVGGIALGGTNALYAACSGYAKGDVDHAVAMRINR
jgi:hypothetical protein